MIERKKPGVHRWVAIASYSITQEEAMNGHEGVPVELTHGKLLSVDAGCIDCEQPFGDHDPICSAKAYKGFD